MSGILSRFRIEALHNKFTFDLEFENNRLILVGENGTGKSTVANILFFVLTQQWRKINQYIFENIVMVLDTNELIIKKDDLSYGIESDLTRRRVINRHNIPIHVKNIIERTLYEYKGKRNNIDELTIIIEKRTGIPRSLISVYLRDSNFISLLETSLKETFETNLIDSNLLNAENILNESIKDQILYLPTYRRIEQDLQSIFPWLDIDSSNLHQDFRDDEKKYHYIELVEFGMEDVVNLLNKKMNEFKENIRNELSKLTGTYLRDVIKGAYHTTDLLSKLKELDDNAIDSIFNRIPESILPSEEQNKLRNLVSKTKDSGCLNEDDKVTAHFLTQLIILHKKQQEEE